MRRAGWAGSHTLIRAKLESTRGVCEGGRRMKYRNEEYGLEIQLFS